MRISKSLRLLLFALLLSTSAVSFAQIGISVRFGPPALPVYEQPVCPGDGYLWTPGYWAWDPDIQDYYWVPGTWILAPEVGFFWTPPWWGWEGGAFLFHAGWWGPHIGFYGGINYGFGYFGTGFVGGRWDGGHFFYNRSVANINVTNIHNVYNTTVINNNVTVNRVSYNGGEGGITARPTAEEQAADNDRHIAPIAAQTEHINAARSNPQLRASVNHGKPAIAATARANDFSHGAVQAKSAGGAYTPHPAGERGANNVPRPPANHASEVQEHERMPAPNTGNAKTDQKYQAQQDKLYNNMQKEHQQLQQKQEAEHQKAQQQNYSQQRQQQMEQKHAQQTQQMEQRHTQQIQHLQQQQSRPPGRK